jgi:hypothetical protein
MRRMDVYDLWNDSLNDIKQKVTGVNVWTALNCAVPITLDGDTFVIGLRPQDNSLKGHLNHVATKRAIEEEVGRRVGKPVTVRVLDGITINDWLNAKKRDEEAERIRQEAAEKEGQRVATYSVWEDVFEQISALYGQFHQKGFAQNRARFLEQCIQICVNQLKARPELTEFDERNLARVLERIGSYTETPPVFVGYEVLKRAGML